MCWVRFPCALGWAHVEHCMSHVSMFLGTRKSVSTLSFPFGSPMLPFEVREVVCLLEMSPFVPHLDSMSNGYIRAFGPCVPSFTMYAHVCSPPCGLKLHSVFLFMAESYYSVHTSSIFCTCSCGWIQTFLQGKVPSWVFSESAVCWKKHPKPVCLYLVVFWHGLLECFE